MKFLADWNFNTGSNAVVSGESRVRAHLPGKNRKLSRESPETMVGDLAFLNVLFAFSCCLVQWLRKMTKLELMTASARCLWFLSMQSFLRKIKKSVGLETKSQPTVRKLLCFGSVCLSLASVALFVMTDCIIFLHLFCKSDHFVQLDGRWGFGGERREGTQRGVFCVRCLLTHTLCARMFCKQNPHTKHEPKHQHRMRPRCIWPIFSVRCAAKSDWAMSLSLWARSAFGVVLFCVF